MNWFVGLESPTHALRADADPSAQSASATYITLAQEHPYDRHIEIILHLSGEQWQIVPEIFALSLGVNFCLFFNETFILKHFHRTSHPTGHLRERQTLLQRVRTADLLPSGFHSLHPQRLRTWEKGWWILPLFAFHTVSHAFMYICPNSINWVKMCENLTAGVCEEAAPQGHSEQPCLDAQLLSWLAVWTLGAAQSHQRATVPCRSQRQHEWHQHPSC